MKIKIIRSETRLYLRFKNMKIKVYDYLSNLIGQFSNMVSTARYFDINIIKRIFKTGICYYIFINKLKSFKQKIQRILYKLIM